MALSDSYINDEEFREAMPDYVVDYCERNPQDVMILEELAERANMCGSEIIVLLKACIRFSACLAFNLVRDICNEDVSNG